MASYLMFSVQLLLLTSAASASHFYGGTMRFVPKGRNPDGSLQVDLHSRQTYRSCNQYHDWTCGSGKCGNKTGSESGVIDSSSNSAPYTNGWCETERVESIHFQSVDPFEIRKASCCWIHNVNNQGSWRLFTHVDLRERSDNWQANSSPNNAIMPFLRVPVNCPRSYRLMTVDPDGDQVICRYGTILSRECNTCNQPTGFYLDEAYCVLHYSFTEYTGVYGFELVVEDFPKSPITLTSTNGTQTTRSPLTAQRHKRSICSTSSATAFTTNTRPPTTSTTAQPTTTFQPTITSTTAPPKTTAPPTTTTASSTTTTASPTSTTASPTTTTVPPTTTGPATTTKTTTATSSKTAPWWTTRQYPPPTRQYPPSLSKLPLQFSLLVDSAAPSCTEGEYLPRFVYPTPSHGDHLKAQVNKELEMRIKAQASHSKVGDIIFSGPLNTAKHRIAQGEFFIRWTPTQDNLGDQVPICFIAEASLSYQQYQSEMRCVVVDVEHVKANVICNETSMTVELDRSSFIGLSEDHLRLNDPSNTACRLHSNGTHAIGIIPLNACGTTIEEDNDNLIFKNKLTTFDDVRDITTRNHLLEIGFSCQYPKRGNVTLGFTVHRDNFTILERGVGMFTYNFEFYPDNRFGTVVNPSLYPLEYDVGEKIYMQIEATSSVNNTVLFVDSCSASPYDNPNYQPTYPIIKNGCTVDPTIVIYSPSHNKEFRFSIDAFKFIGLHDQVYISCSVILCEAGNLNTRCSRGCVPPTYNHWRRRAALIETGAHFISQGPLRLRRTPESESRANGCLLAAIAMICGVMIHRFKRAAVQYQPLPTTEQ